MRIITHNIDDHYQEMIMQFSTVTTITYPAWPLATVYGLENNYASVRMRKRGIR